MIWQRHRICLLSHRVACSAWSACNNLHRQSPSRRWRDCRYKALVRYCSRYGSCLCYAQRVCGGTHGSWRGLWYQAVQLRYGALLLRYILHAQGLLLRYSRQGLLQRDWAVRQRIRLSDHKRLQFVGGLSHVCIL